MRVLLVALLAFALGFAPAASARAATQAASPPAAMACHDMAGTMQDMNADQQSGDGMQTCADHCLSLINGQPVLARLSSPALQNAISANAVQLVSQGKLHHRDPPDPPPPRA
ncbi:MAG: hypothetical protein NW206_06220 [Hyphomonadaceae bacterium]|nr:hypothetical protein [Hyphomonadaceae bacterium]